MTNSSANLEMQDRLVTMEYELEVSKARIKMLEEELSASRLGEAKGKDAVEEVL